MLCAADEAAHEQSILHRRAGGGRWAAGVKRFSRIQKTVAIFGGGKNAGFGTAEDAVAAAGDDVVAEVAQGARKEFENKGCRAPHPSELRENEGDSLRAWKQRFSGSIRVYNDIHRVEVPRIRAMSR